MNLIIFDKPSKNRKPFNYDSVAGLVLDLNPQVGVYQDSALTTLATANNDPVGGWKDQSTAGNNATQATAAKKPTLQNNIINGRAIIRFDAVDDILQTVATIINTNLEAYTIFAVVKFSAGGALCAQEKSGTQNGVLIQQDRVDYHTNSIGNVISFSTSGFIIVSMKGATPNYSIQENNVNESSVSSAAGAGASSTQFTVGNRDGGTVPLGGDIARLLVYNAAVSAADETLIENGLSADYGITL